MQKFSIILLACIGCFLFVGWSACVFAADEVFSVLCKEQETCKKLDSDKIPIFTEENIVPGQSFVRKLLVRNENKLHTCNLHLRLSETSAADKNKLAAQLQAKVLHDGSLVLGSTSSTNALTIAQLQSENFARYFWSVPPKSAASFDVVITFNAQAGNQYQGAIARTDIAVAITCLTEDEFSSASESAVVLPLEKKPSAEIPLQSCTTEVSQRSPALKVTHSEIERSAISFSWDSISGAEEYWLEFGSEPNSDQFRHRGITTEKYTVIGIDMSNDLYFRVLPVAGCARGHYSDVVKVAGKNGKKVSVPENAKNPQVLGAQERVISENDSNIQVPKTQPLWWILILVGVTICLFIFVA